MRIITLDPIMVKDTSTYKGLNTQTFSGLRHRSQSAELQLGDTALTSVPCLWFHSVTEMLPWGHAALSSELQPHIPDSMQSSASRRSDGVSVFPNNNGKKAHLITKKSGKIRQFSVEIFLFPLQNPDSYPWGKRGIRETKVKQRNGGDAAQ